MYPGEACNVRDFCLDESECLRGIQARMQFLACLGICTCPMSRPNLRDHQCWPDSDGRFASLDVHNRLQWCLTKLTKVLLNLLNIMTMSWALPFKSVPTSFKNNILNTIRQVATSENFVMGLEQIVRLKALFAQDTFVNVSFNLYEDGSRTVTTHRDRR